ncbi:MAG TPA: DUF177 domain-containing protein [Euzebyales bacterium]|nr:DUF177 domain-containing protein [Euzebyales bacterium]
MPPLADTVVVVRELTGRPGTSRQLERSMPAPGGLSDEIVRIGDRVTVDGIIESVVDGLLVRGTVGAPARVACVRCLAERDDAISADVMELFRAPGPGDDDDAVDAGYEIVDDTIDLVTLLRDALAAARPSHPLCRPDCAGLCATCGADLNAAPCGGHGEDADPRWSALAGLELPVRSAEPGAAEPDAHQ